MQTGVAQTAVLHTSLSRFFPSHDYYLIRSFTLQQQRTTSKKDVLGIEKPIAGFLGIWMHVFKFSLDRAYCYIEEGRSQLHDSGRAPHWNILRANFWSSAVTLS